MSDIEITESDMSLDPIKKRTHKTTKTIPTPASPLAVSPDIKEVVAKLLKNSIDKYSDIANNQLKNTRDDFECLQKIVSEFLEDYTVIGHTLDGQRVVIRYASTPAQLDSLTELCKKILIQMMIQEQTGQ